MGCLNNKNSQEFYLHLGLEITPERLCLGVIDFNTWIRKKLGLRKTRQNKSTEEKETYCWLKGYNIANEIELALQAPYLLVKDSETAINIVKWYLCRQETEIFFKILKSGCTIEKLQFKNLRTIINCVALYTIVAWRILYLTTLIRVYPDMKCDNVFETN